VSTWKEKHLENKGLVRLPNFVVRLISLNCSGESPALKLNSAVINHFWLVVEPTPLKNMKVKGKDYPIYYGT
jgi:hypothetical protein